MDTDDALVKKVEFIDESKYTIGGGAQYLMAKTCYNGDIPKIKTLIKELRDYYDKLYGFWYDNSEWNAGLIGAAKAGNIEVVELMIEEGATRFIEPTRAAFLGGKLNVAKMIIKKFKTVPGCRNYNYPLCEFIQEAVRGNNIESVEYLSGSGYCDCYEKKHKSYCFENWTKAVIISLHVDNPKMVKLCIQVIFKLLETYETARKHSKDIMKLLLNNVPKLKRSCKQLGYDIINHLCEIGVSIKFGKVKPKFDLNVAIIDLLDNGIRMIYLEKLQGFDEIKKNIDERRNCMIDTLELIVIKDVLDIVATYMIC